MMFIISCLLIAVMQARFNSLGAPDLEIELRGAENAQIIGFLDHAKSNAIIGVNELSDKQVLAAIERARNRRVDVVVILFPLRGGSREARGLPAQLVRKSGFMILDCKWAWFGASRWTGDDYSALSTVTALSAENRQAWSRYLAGRLKAQE